MEKIIIVWEKEVLSNMDFIKNIIALNVAGILVVNPKDKDYEEIIKECNNNSDLILNEPITKKLKKEIEEEFNKILELKNQKILDANIIIDKSPWYNRFLKKWDKYDHQSYKPNPKKKWNKRK